MWERGPLCTWASPPLIVPLIPRHEDVGDVQFFTDVIPLEKDPKPMRRHFTISSGKNQNASFVELFLLKFVTSSHAHIIRHSLEKYQLNAVG